MESDRPGRGGRLGFTEKDFKVCDFCGALNLVTNSKCFICGWEGHFHTEAEAVQAAMSELEREHGHLNEALFAEEVLPDEPGAQPSWVSRLVAGFRKFLRGDE
jgi:hypothetical protein